MSHFTAALFLIAAGWSFTEFSLDKLRWNARERTEAGLEKLAAESPEAAVEAFETAARLDAEDPVLRFNAGSAHLEAGTDGALPHLEFAAESQSDGLGAAAHYNLGNARFEAGDSAGAIAAFEQALRSDPSHEDAKFNLELALRQQQQQQEQQQQQDKDGESGDEGEDEENSSKPNEDEEEQDSEGSNSPSPQAEPQDSQEDQESEPRNDSENGRNEQLPRFEEQPDMTAEQAAAILEAVENLEREQRREQAEKEMKKRSRKGKDW